jgi:hypothetical protein
MFTKGIMKQRCRILFWGLAVLGTTCSAGASTINFTTGNFSVSGLGDENNSGFDKISITGLSGTAAGVDSSNPQTATIATLTFQSGLNCIVCSPNPSGSAIIDFTFAGNTQQLAIPYLITLSALPGPDRLDLSGGALLSFPMGGGQTLVIDSVAFTMSSAGVLKTGNLTATFSVSGAQPPATPEPATLLMFLTGLGAIVYFKGIRAANVRATASALSCGRPATPARKTPFAKT